MKHVSLSHPGRVLQDMVITVIMSSHIIEWNSTISPEVQSFCDGLTHHIRECLCVCVCVKSSARQRDKEEEVNTSLHISAGKHTFWKSLPSLVATHL